MSSILHRTRFQLDHRWAPARMSDYLDDELADRRRRRLERHASECAACRRTLTGLRATVAALQSLPPPSGAADAARIADSIRPRL